MAATDQVRDLHFPTAGLDLTQAYCEQQPRAMPSGEYARTSRLGQNVRAYEPGQQRSRGGVRPGLARYVTTAPVASWLIQELALVVGTGYPPPGGTMQSSALGRVVTLVAVSQGNVYTVSAGGTSWTLATNGTGRPTPLNYTGIVRSSAMNQKLWFADGGNWAYYDPSVNTVFTWLASAGTLPSDNAGNLPRLIATWRGRMVLSGLLNDPQNWFMSAVGDPTNWNYFPVPVVTTEAVAGNNGPQGVVGDVVTALIPYTDDLLIFGTDHEIWSMKGDPAAGGQLDVVTKAIGIAFGQAWCQDPYGTIYFLSNRTGIYSMQPGQLPQRISQPIEQLLQAFDTGRTTTRLIWNDRWQCLHVFMSPTSAPGLTTHFCWEQRSNAWWTDQFGSTLQDPLCCVTFDGNTPGDRAALIGSWDGYVRNLSTNAATDDGVAIPSAVVIGPVCTPELDDMLLKSLQAVMGADSGAVTYQVYVGGTAEQALSTTPVASGTWGAGRNLSNLVRRAGHAVYVKLSASNPWSLEQIRMALASTGKVRGRGA